MTTLIRRCCVTVSSLLQQYAPSIQRAPLITFLLALPLFIICSWTARTLLKGRRRNRRSCKTLLKVDSHTELSWMHKIGVFWAKDADVLDVTHVTCVY